MLPWEKRLDSGENGVTTVVSASEVLVDVECLAFLDSKGLGTRAGCVCWLGSNFETKVVSASDVLEDVDCLAFLESNGDGTRVGRVCWLASNFATVSETRDPLRSNEYPGFLRGGNICDA